MIENFLQLYPAWPQALAESFRDLLAYAVPGSEAWQAAENFYRAETEKTYITKYPGVAGYGWNQQFSADLMKPTNQQFTQSINQEKQYVEWPIDQAVKSGLSSQQIEYWKSQGIFVNEFGVSPIETTRWRFRPYIQTRYDTRLFSAVQNFFDYKFTPTFGPYQISFLSIMSYSHAEAYSGKTELLMSAKGTPREFTGINSIIALHENGATLPDVQIQKLYEFRTYVNAYTKFSAQVEAEAKSIAYAAESEIINYQATLAQDLATEKRALDNLALDLQNQMQVEAAAVQRDLTNTLLTAQTLAAQLSSGFR